MTTYSIPKSAIPKMLGNRELAAEFDDRAQKLSAELQKLSQSGDITHQDIHRIKLLSEARTTAFNLDAMGMYKSIITVKDAPFAHPRAYVTYPTIYIDERGKRINSSEIWVDVPSGYNLHGDSIKPSLPFRIIQDDVAKKTLKSAFGSPFASPELTIMSITPKGTTLAANYVRNDTVENAFDWGDKEVFVFNTADSESANDVFNIAKTKELREQAQFIPYGESHLVIAFNRAVKIPEEIKALPRLDVKTYAWMREDREDIQMSREIPPMPREVKDDLQSAGLDVTKYRSLIRRFTPLS